MTSTTGQRVCQSYRVLVGLEIHVQLATASKMFTSAPNRFGAEPNTLVDPVVLGLPGVLPTMNKKAVESSILVGLALNCRIARHTKWDRKSYYYPDLPKNYQISQYDLPLCAEGWFEIAGEDGQPRRIRIRRAHLEEDAGKLMHEAPGGYPIDGSIVDLNRAGTPLLEIVTEPDFTAPREVAQFGQRLQKLVQYLGVAEAHMERGQMRFEPNINAHITDAAGQVHKTAITEVKNLNSFATLEKATAYEIQRQIRHWEETGSLGKKSTYGWDEATQSTYWQRDKEEAHDYRYFPDPDLMPVEVDDAWLTELKSRVGEMPEARQKRYVEDLGLSAKEAALLVDDRAADDLFEKALADQNRPKRICNLITNTLAQMANERRGRLNELGVPAERLAQVAAMIDAGLLAANDARTVFEATAHQHLDAADLQKRLSDLGLIRQADKGEIDAAIEQLIAQNPRPLQDYLAGKDAAVNALFGQVMKTAKGQNPKTVREKLEAKLKGLRGS